MKQVLKKLNHTIKPFVKPNSKILILGTFPSPKSRESGFYYGHPQNRFWKVLAKVLNQPVPTTAEEKKNFLNRNNIALWDVLASCKIKGASDSSIKDPVPNDIKGILKDTSIKQIFTTGQKAGELYKKYCEVTTGKTAIVLPSPSPANCAMNFHTLVEKYQIIKEFL